MTAPPRPVRPSRWERLANDQAVLAAVFLLPTLLILAGAVVYPFASAVPPRRVRRRSRRAEGSAPEALG